MKKTQLSNKFEVENIIRKTLTDMFIGVIQQPFYANDTEFGTGHTFKYRSESRFNKIWPTVLKKLHSLGLTEWQMSCPVDSSLVHKPKSTWTGIRSDRLPRRSR